MATDPKCPLKAGLQCSDPDRFKASTPCPGCTAKTRRCLVPTYGGSLAPVTLYLAYEPEEIRLSTSYVTANSTEVVL